MGWGMGLRNLMREGIACRIGKNSGDSIEQWDGIGIDDSI